MKYAKIGKTEKIVLKVKKAIYLPFFVSKRALKGLSAMEIS
jgi:hypothetical protein